MGLETIIKGMQDSRTLGDNAVKFGLAHQTVNHVSDGDTATVQDKNGQPVRIRFWGADTPESRSNNKWPDQPYSKEAANFTKAMIENKEVMVRMTGETTYNRHVGEIFVDGRSVSRELVRNGLAHWYKSYAKHDSDLERLEKKAKGQKRGIWGDPKAVTPDTWRNKMNHNCTRRDDC